MKIRTKEQLENALDEELAWRIKELRTLKLNIEAARGDAQRTLCRAMSTLLYAHWEGFVSEAVARYFDYVRSLRLTYEELAPCLYGVALQGRMANVSQAKRPGPYVELARFLRESRTERAHLPDRLEDGGNLNAAVLRGLLMAVDIDYGSFELLEKLIDERLVKTRNQVAHGQSNCPAVPDLIELHEEVERMLRLVHDGLADCVQAERFKAAHATPSRATLPPPKP